MGWFRLASHLHLPLQECQAKTTSTEFVTWMKYLLLERNAFHREDYYWAQVAAEIRKGNVKYPKRVRLKDLLIKFVVERKMSKSKQTRMDSAKRWWKTVVGYKLRR